MPWCMYLVLDGCVQMLAGLRSCAVSAIMLLCLRARVNQTDSQELYVLQVEVEMFRALLSISPNGLHAYVPLTEQIYLLVLKLSLLYGNFFVRSGIGWYN